MRVRVGGEPDVMTMSRDDELECLLALACSIVDVPNALLTLAGGGEIGFGRSGDVDARLRKEEPALRERMVRSGRNLLLRDAGPGGCLRFYAGTLLASDAGEPYAALSLFDEHPRDFGRDEWQALARLAGLMTTVLRQRRDARALAWLSEDLEAQRSLVRQQAEALAHSQKIFERSSAAAKIGVWECDLTRGNALRWTDAVYDLFEIPRGTPIDRSKIVELYFPESRAEMETARARAIRERGRFSLDARIRTMRGNERWMRLTADVECENGVAVRIFGMKQDITEEKALWDRTRFLAETDVMTGLANRSLFQATLAGFEEGPAARPVGALLLVDLDGFKHINDTFGHALGDECLKQIAGRLSRACRDAALVARIGGDEFAILLEAPVEPADVEAFAERILSELRLPVRRDEHAFQLGASIGIAIPATIDACRASDLFTYADIALYAAKACGKNTFRIFDPRMKSKGDRRFETIREVASALADDRMELYYQPKIRLADGLLSGFEALLRRRMPDGQVVSAGTFHSALEDPELSARLGKWVVETALRQAGLWHRAGLDFGNIAVNLSTAQLHDHRFAEHMIQRIAEHGLDPAMIEVEVTEGVFLDREPGPVTRVLERLKQTGIRVALDDFGTGYASLVHLRSYPIDVIKIDKSFVQRFLKSTQDRAILETILRLGASLGMDIVAEGIETAEQHEALKALGCQLGQGFLFSKAIPATEAEEWLGTKRENLVA